MTARASRTLRAAIVAALLIAAGAIAGPAAAATEHQIGTFNMAGGNADHGDKGDEAPDALVASIEDRQPAFVMLQEACRDWTERLDGELGDYTVVFDPVTLGDGSTAQCKHPSEFGNAILYRNDFGVDGAPVAHSLGSPAGAEQREMLCVTASSRNAVICTAHLTAGDGDDNAQARAVEAETARTLLDTVYAGRTAFLGGDLNADPLAAELNPLYHVDYEEGASGALKEVDSPCGNDIARLRVSYPTVEFCRSGELTADDWIFEEGSPVGRKIDYVFVSPHVEVLDADATFGIHSDHDPLWADVAF